MPLAAASQKQVVRPCSRQQGKDKTVSDRLETVPAEIGATLRAASDGRSGVAEFSRDAQLLADGDPHIVQFHFA